MQSDYSLRKSKTARRIAPWSFSICGSAKLAPRISREFISDDLSSATQSLMMVGNMALKRFLDRRLSITALPTPPLPEGRTDHAPLELLSTVALKQLRLSISQEKEPLHAVRNLPSSGGTLESKGPREAVSVRLSPVSSDGLQAPNLPSPHPLQNASFGDLRMRRNLDAIDEQQHQDGDPRKLMLTSRSSSEQNDQSHSSSHLDRNVSSGRVLKPHAGPNSQASGKPRCQSSKFCHICMFFKIYVGTLPFAES